MSAPIGTMIGIRTGGVLSGDVDINDLKNRIIVIINRLEEDEDDEDYVGCGIDAEDLHYCLSPELSGTKGSYIVIAGVFNYWSYDNGLSEFCKILSKEFCTEVMVMARDETNDTVQHGIFSDGEDINRDSCVSYGGDE